MTVAATLGVLNAVGIQLHQVSIAGLIVSLGILVDDAIVIADNYVELLDHKVPPVTVHDLFGRCSDASSRRVSQIPFGVG